MTTKKAAAKLRSKNTYSVIRVEFVTATGTPARLWNVSVKRHGRLFNRNFYDATYGGQEPARLMGLAYRDCLMQLFPPLTQLEQRTKVRANNKSGVSGVMAKYDRGRLKAWQATIEVSGVVHQKYFSVREFGEEKAKELAIKARQAFLAQCPLNRFVTVNADATQHAESTFAELLNMDAANGSPLNAGLVPDTDTINRQLELLNAWFDALRPQCIHVRLSVYPIPSRAHTGLFVVVGDGNAPGGALQRKNWSMQSKSYQEALVLAWQYVQTIITAQMGADCWQEFQARYQEQVFASTAAEAVFIRHWYHPPGGAPLRTAPPVELLPMLREVNIPVLTSDI